MRKKHTVAARLNDVFYNVESRWFHPVNDILAIATIVSVLALILETVPALKEYTSIFNTIEYTAVGLFTLEYLGRIVARKKDVGSYVFSFFGIIDLLAIVPTYFGLTNLTFLKTARVLRLLRLLRMIRLAKLAQVRRHHHSDIEHHKDLYKFSVRIYFVALLASVTIFGTLIYVAESSAPHFSSIPLGMIWAAKVTMGGVAQHMPSTVWGEVVTIGARFTGLALLGLLISIMGDSVRRLLFGTDIKK